jgi:hypothetical protein
MNPFRDATRATHNSLFSICLSQRLTKSKAIAFGLIALLLIVFTGHRTASYKMNTREWVNAPINDVYRVCPPPDYPTIPVDANGPNGYTDAGKICVTTLTDAKKGPFLQRLIRWRNFDQLLEMTWPNKVNWTKKHGYHLFDESDSLDRSRPPSWSKIKATQRLLEHEACDWVLWLDADTVIMNSEKKIEAFLPMDPSIDLLINRQKGGSYNAGAWVIRNSPWSKQFLQRWWDMKEFVHPPGMSTSGDNAALKAYLTDQMDPAEFSQHIAVPPRCTFNSVTIFLSPQEAALVTDPETIKKQEYYMNPEKYHKGDLVAHVAGKNNKIDTTALLLKDAT